MALSRSRLTDQVINVSTGSTVGVVPIKNLGLYEGKIDKLGFAKAVII